MPDETKAVSAIEVERTANDVSLILNLVARPFAFTQPREVVFNLQATPVRPLPDDFRQRRFHILGTMAFCAGDDGVDGGIKLGEGGGVERHGGEREREWARERDYFAETSVLR